MRNKKKIAVLGALLAGGLLLLPAVQRIRQNREVVLEFSMFNGSNWEVAIQDSYPVIDAAVARFEAEHPGVRVHFASGILKEDYPEWLSRRMLADKTPDVMMILDSDFSTLSELGMLECLDQWMEGDQSFRKDAYYETALSSGRIRGMQYALPMETVPTLMFVNKTLLNGAGIEMPREDYTFADFYDICRKITKDTDGDGLNDQFGTYKYTWVDAAMANGVDLFSEDGQSCDFTSPELLEAIRFSKTLTELNGGQKVTQETFDSGRVAFMPLNYAEYRTYKSYPYRIKKYSAFQWDCLLMPRGPSGDNVSIVDSLNVGICSRSRHKELAWEFLRLLTGDPEIQRKLYMSMPVASVLPEVTETQPEAEMKTGTGAGPGGKTASSGETEGKEALIDGSFIGRIIAEGRTKPKFASYQEAMELADGEIQKLYDEETDLDNAMRLIQRRVQKFITR